LDRWLNPGVFTIDPVTDPRPAADWIGAVETAYPTGRVIFVTLPQAPNEPATLFLAPRIDSSTGKPVQIPQYIDQVFVHPGTADILGARNRDGFRFDRLHAVPFLHTLHYSLHLGQWGMWLFGGVALFWVFDCFVGLYLASPRPRWNAVRQALGVKWKAGKARVQYDLHRAAGLWLWIVLLVLAFTGVSLNLHDEVFDPAVNAIAPMTPFPGEDAPDREDPSSSLPLPIPKVIASAERGLRESGLSGSLGSIWLNYAKGLYHLGYHTDADLMRAHPGAWVSLSAATGEVIDVRPAGGHTIGDAIHDWQFPLHSGRAFGLPGHILICLSGLVVAMLSITGVMIWWRKRRRRSERLREASLATPG